ncbi:MAG TPA: phosphoribosyltransferase family protein [Polyangiaceae bacterium]|nr:phosphoribosyltransferase family protein [Polyangiaceae bacterium]
MTHDTSDMTFPRRFHDRAHAGRELAKHLSQFRSQFPIVLGLPRGGVPVAYEVAQALDAPLDVWVVRKLGAPDQPELGMGAVAEGGEIFIDARIVREVGATEQEVQEIVARKTAEVDDRSRRLRRGRGAPDLEGKTVLLVDDGIATGGTARAALRAIRRRGPRAVVLAVPVGATATLEALASEADQIVCLSPQAHLYAIGLWYEKFDPVEDEDVVALLDRSRDHEEKPLERSVRVSTAEAELHGDLAVPHGASGVVLFAHGSGSSRKSRRNRLVARVLQRAGLATLLFDLLTEDEEREDAVDAHLRFDIGLLAQRLVGATDWVTRRDETRGLRVGYFGASTGAAAALIAAVERAGVVDAVVSRGGRPDLAETWLPHVRAPTLLIVGGDDREVLALNRSAFRNLGGPKSLEVVAHATHLFEEPGALERVAELAAGWFGQHLQRAGTDAHAAVPGH